MWRERGGERERGGRSVERERWVWGEREREREREKYRRRKTSTDKTRKKLTVEERFSCLGLETLNRIFIGR